MMRKKWLTVLFMAVFALVGLTGCQNAGFSNTESSGTQQEKQEEFGEEDLASIVTQSDRIKDTLLQGSLPQQEMNIKAEELYKLWDDALNDLWSVLKDRLPEKEFSELLDAQRAWIADKEDRVEKAGKDYVGGSMHTLVVSMEAADITEERVFELYEFLK